MLSAIQLKTMVTPQKIAPAQAPVIRFQANTSVTDKVQLLKSQTHFNGQLNALELLTAINDATDKATQKQWQNNAIAIATLPISLPATILGTLVTIPLKLLDVLSGHPGYRGDDDEADFMEIFPNFQQQGVSHPEWTLLDSFWGDIEGASPLFKNCSVPAKDIGSALRLYQAPHPESPAHDIALYDRKKKQFQQLVQELGLPPAEVPQEGIDRSKEFSAKFQEACQQLVMQGYLGYQPKSQIYFTTPLGKAVAQEAYGQKAL